MYVCVSVFCACVCVLLQQVKPRSQRQNTEEASGLLTCKSCECAEGGSVGSENVVRCACIAVACVCTYVRTYMHMYIHTCT